MRSLELRVPPVVLVLLAGAAMWGIARITSSLTHLYPARTVVALVLAFTGIALAIAGVVAFRRAQTTVDPRDPGKSSAVVTAGVYRWTRNPMYLGFLVMLFGWSAYLANPVAALVPLVFAMYMSRFQIAPEERILRARFGAPYEAYLLSVRRWI